MSSTIELEGLLVRRSAFQLGPLDLTIRPGRTGLVGLNGVGKSTLMEALVGRLRHRGSMRIDDATVDHLPPASTGYVAQRAEHPPLLTVRDCVAAAADLKRVAPQDRELLIAEALSTVDLDQAARVRASRLSGGQRRRLACAQAIVHRPRVLLLDEPTAGLDPVQRQGMRAFLASRSPSDVTVVTTHILEDIATWADRLLVLDSGKMKADLDLTRIPSPERLGAVERMLVDGSGAST